tara:strand:- start:302 stop:1078 length:777 start_codon:yes stop_codon:yes gene_type:complete
MANWFPNSKADKLAPVPFVDGLPRMTTSIKSTVQNNPANFPGVEALGHDGTSKVKKYMHYCTRIIRWNDIDPSKLNSIDTSNPDHKHKTKRFGDLGGYYKHKGGSIRTMLANSDLKSAFTRYRFHIHVVPYYLYGSRGMFCGNPKPFENDGRGDTCGFILGDSDPSFFWTPSSADMAQLSSGIDEFLARYQDTSLVKLAECDQRWNLAIVAWMWAGYQPVVRDNAHSIIQQYKGTKDVPDGVKRQVEECDVWFFAFIY